MNEPTNSQLLERVIFEMGLIKVLEQINTHIGLIDRSAERELESIISTLDDKVKDIVGRI